jgi:hypothetical protein
MWKDIIWYYWFYQVSDSGFIKSFHNGKCNILNPSKNTWWYLFLNLSYKWKVRPKTVHRIVAEVFIPNPDNKPQVNHINWVKTDNRVENLEWVTWSENIKHAFKLWLVNNNFQFNHPSRWVFGKDHFNSKKINQYTLHWEFIKTWDSIMDINRELWISRTAIWNNCNLISNSSGGFIWKFYN